MRAKRTIGVAVLVAIACCTPQPAKAIFGVGDSVIICGDLMDEIKWARELEQWTTQINKITEQVQKADTMIKIVGDPKRLGSELLTVIDMSTLDAADDAAGLSLASATIDLGKSVYTLAAVGKKTVRDADHIGDKYSMFGEEMQRDGKRYESFGMQQALQVRFDTSVSSKEKIDAKELALQRKILESLKDPAMTQNGRIAAEAALAASKARMDLAASKVRQARDEYDMFGSRMRMEAERKAAATNEESEAMIAAMREKAIASMNRQAGGIPQ